VNTVGILALRALAGGSLVVVFAAIGEVVSPKVFSGLFAAAPSVALASLLITVATQGSAKARTESLGMVFGALAMTACCALAVAAIPKFGALRGSAAAWLGWGTVAMGLYWAVFFGAR
jgi:hypothetical protein